VTNHLPPPKCNSWSSPQLEVSYSRGRILAVDYGRRRIGLALSDELRMTVRPLGILEHTNRRHDLRRLREIARQHGVGLILVGHPLYLEGTAGEMATEAERFARRVARELGIPVYLADERLTSWEARRISCSVGQAPNGKHNHDDVAAAIILRDFLSHRFPMVEPSQERP
jgi:putative Holliday junction resolvase